MDIREVVVRDDESRDDAGTKVIDIKVTAPITELIVRLAARNAASITTDAPIDKNITRIELVDGGRTYWNLNGPMSVAAGAYALGQWPSGWYDERLSTYPSIAIPMRFGRYLGDQQFAFDPTRLNTPQLRITWPDSASYLDDSLTLGVTARVMEGAPSPSQCLIWREVDAWASATSGVKTVDLPTDYPYRSLLMRAYISADVLTNAFTHLKLDCDLGKLILFDMDISEFQDIINEYLPIFQRRHFMVRTHNAYPEAWMGETLGVDVSPASLYHMVYAFTAFWSFYNFHAFSDGDSGLSDCQYQSVVTGRYPHSTLKYDFGRPDDPATWFEPGRFGDVDLKITEGSAQACAVAIQQPRSLP